MNLWNNLKYRNLAVWSLVYFGVAAGAAFADEPDVAKELSAANADEVVDPEVLRSDCQSPATGSILFKHNNRYQNFPATLNNIRTDGGTLSVGYGTTNYVTKTELERGPGGRTILKLYFQDVPSLARGQSALMVGTLLSDSSSQNYYGDIYIREADTDYDPKAAAKIDMSHGWRHSGGFRFTRNLH